MKLPFVSRARLEEQVDEADAWATAHTEMERQATYANQATQELSSMLKDLTAKYDDLVKKVMDRHVPDPVMHEPQDPILPAEVMKAIGERSDPGSVTYSHLVNQALQMQQFGDQGSDIVDAILAGDEAPV